MTTTPAHPGIPAPPKGEFFFPTPAIPNRVIKMEDDIMERVCRLLFEGKLVEKVCSPFLFLVQTHSLIHDDLKQK